MQPLCWLNLAATAGVVFLALSGPALAGQADSSPQLACEPEAYEANKPPLLLDEAAKLALDGKLEREHQLDLMNRAEFHESNSGDSVRGEFLLDDLRAVIFSERTPSGGAAYSITLGTKVFEGNLSLPEFGYRIDGHGNSVSTREKIFLIALAWRLEKESWSESQSEKSFVYRLANMLSEIPVGYEFKVIEFTVRKEDRKALLNFLNAKSTEAMECALQVQ